MPQNVPAADDVKERRSLRAPEDFVAVLYRSRRANKRACASPAFPGICDFFSVYARLVAILSLLRIFPACAHAKPEPTLLPHSRFSRNPRGKTHSELSVESLLVPEEGVEPTRY